MRTPGEIRRLGLVQKDGFLWIASAFILYFGLPIVGIRWSNWVALAVLVYAVFRLSRALGHSVLLSVALSIASAFALLGLVCFFVLNVKATKALRYAGLKVGFFGVNEHDLPREQ